MMNLIVVWHGGCGNWWMLIHAHAHDYWRLLWYSGSRTFGMIMFKNGVQWPPFSKKEGKKKM